MLSRTAANLYWIGRYMERAEFASRLVEATIRLSSLGDHVESDQAWRSALKVVGTNAAFERGGEAHSAFNVRRFLTLGEKNPISIRCCLSVARDNARAARTALTVEAAGDQSRRQIVRGSHQSGGAQANLRLGEELKAEIRGFEGSLGRMLRSESSWFLHLGSVIERGDNTARLLDVKYYLLLPPGQEVGGTLDRDQWNTLLQIVSARTAYRHIYSGPLQPWLVADLLVFRSEMPCSLAASAEEAVTPLSAFARRSGRQGPADPMAAQGQARMQ